MRWLQRLLRDRTWERAEAAVRERYDVHTVGGEQIATEKPGWRDPWRTT